MTKEAIELPGASTGVQLHVDMDGKIVSQPAWSTMAVLVDGSLKRMSPDVEEEDSWVSAAFEQERPKRAGKMRW